ncbi:MAG: DinB family protein [Candidatus Geothermincolia bacterium]
MPSGATDGWPFGDYQSRDSTSRTSPDEIPAHSADLTPPHVATKGPCQSAFKILRTYHALDGSPRTIPVWSVFNHVVNHGTYHRGQIANRLARRGCDVPVTDLIIWAAEAVASPA